MTPPATQPQRIAILLSGRGSNFRAIWKAQQEGRLGNGEVVFVFSNRAKAEGLTFAREQGLATASLKVKDFESREAYDEAVLALLQKHEINWVVLAGYSRIVTPVLTQAYARRMINMHPSLLPKFGGPGMLGIKVHEAVLAAGETESGCTVHYVIDEVDGGHIIAQATVPVLPADTPDSLAQRVLTQEHQLYPTVLRTLLS